MVVKEEGSNKKREILSKTPTRMRYSGISLLRTRTGIWEFCLLLQVTRTCYVGSFCEKWEISSRFSIFKSWFHFNERKSPKEWYYTSDILWLRSVSVATGSGKMRLNGSGACLRKWKTSNWWATSSTCRPERRTDDCNRIVSSFLIEDINNNLP